VKGREDILKSRMLRPFAHLFAHPSLWHLNRRSVPRGLALGVFVSFILPVGQFALAALLAVPLRANVPLSAAATLVSNPLTFGPIYYAAYKTGEFLLRAPAPDETRQAATSYAAQLLDVSGPTAIGLLVFACVCSPIGYAVGALLWRWKLVRRWKGKQPR
jgi:uncharacterized protein (DUF2062 family)